MNTCIASEWNEMTDNIVDCVTLLPCFHYETGVGYSNKILAGPVGIVSDVKLDSSDAGGNGSYVVRSVCVMPKNESNEFGKVRWGGREWSSEVVEAEDPK